MEQEPIFSPLDLALQELQMLFQQAYQLGNNDTESGAIQRIMTEVASGRMTPEAGLKQARAIIDSKNER